MSHLRTTDREACQLNCRTFEGVDFLEIADAWNIAPVEDMPDYYPLQCFLDIIIEQHPSQCRARTDYVLEVYSSDFRKFLTALSENDQLYRSFWQGLVSVPDDYGFLKLCRTLLQDMWVL